MKKDALVEDERGRGFPAVLRYGPYLFMSGSDGFRDLNTEKIVPELADKAVEQCRNAYGRVQKRLEAAGYSGDCALWIENFTSGQHWRLERMALWPDYFGEEGHTRAVSFGAQTKMNGINMLTACVLGVVPEVPRVIGVAQPGRGRASRATQVGDLAFIIGVRGHENPKTKEKVIQETDGAFDAQLTNCFDWLESHMAQSGLALSSLVRVDAALRDVGQAERYRAYARARMSGKIPFGGFAVGTILGGRCEQELGAIAVAPGVPTDIVWLPGEIQAESVRAGSLVFLTASSGVTGGIMGKPRQELYADLGAQVRQSLDNIKAALARRNLGLDSLLRLDVFLRDIYAEAKLVEHLKAILGKDMPVLNVIGTEPEHGADVELVAVAGI